MMRRGPDDRDAMPSGVHAMHDEGPRSALERSERRFRALAQETSTIVWTVDATGMRPDDSASWRAFTGQSVNTWISGAGWEAIHTDDLPVFREAWAAAIASRRPFETQYRLRRHDGAWVPMAVRAAPVFDEHGQLREWIGANVDISDRIAREEERAALLASEREARAIAERARQRLALIDTVTRELVVDLRDVDRTIQRFAELVVPSFADWCVVYVPSEGSIVAAAIAHEDAEKASAAREHLAGRPIDPSLAWGVAAVYRTGATEVASIADAALHADQRAALASTGVRSHLAVAMRGHQRVLGVLGLAITDSERTFSDEDVLVAEDVAKRAALLLEHARLLEETTHAREEANAARARAEDANRAKDEFFAMLGHELRNPLAPIATALAVMKIRDPEASRNERTVIERQVAHVVQLVDDLFDVSKITRGKVELHLTPCNVRSIVVTAAEMAMPLVEQRRHHLSIDVDETLTVEADSRRLAQVFANLFNNAAKYTKPGGRIVVRGFAEGESAVLTVLDDGAGIDAALLPHVFDLFTQGPQSNDRSRGGLGLGLAIVRSLIALHGGSVHASSEGTDRGSEFRVVLPRLAREAAALAPSVENSTTRGGGRVLVVDDNEDARWMMTELLGTMGYEARTAEDGPSALQLLDTFRPDVALLDIGLPVMDGFELARRIRDRADLSGVRLLALTGYGQVSDREATRAAGFDGHLVKPVDVEALSRSLDKPDQG